MKATILQSSSRLRSWKTVLLLVTLTLHILPAATRPALIGGDEPHYALMAHSIAFDGDLQLSDDYDAVNRGAPYAGRKAAGKVLDRHLRVVGGNEVFIHPIGLPLLAAPVLWFNTLVLQSTSPDIALILLTLTVTFVALRLAIRLVAELTGSVRDATLLVTCVYFGSPLWFYSRTFFTEPYIWSFAVFSIAALRSRKFMTASLWLALILAVKETGAVLVLAVVAGSAMYYGFRRSLPLAFGPALYAILFASKNFVTVGSPFSTFQPYQIGDPLAGSFGLLFDRFHGLFWYSPLLGLALVGWVLPSPVRRYVKWPSAAGFVGYFMITAAWIDWRGGSSYATRLLLPALPALIIPGIAAFRAVCRSRFLALLAFVISFVPNWIAANHPFTAFWGETAAPALVGQNPALAVFGIVVALVLLKAIIMSHRAESSTEAGIGYRATFTH